MALPHYRAHEVDIPEGMFTYTVSLGDDGGTGWLIKSLSIKDWCGVGQLLIVKDIPQLPHWRNAAKPSKSKDHRIMKPAFIGRIIRKALELGWDPKGKGQFKLSLLDHPVT